MISARILYLARYRVPHAAFAMQWDHNLQGIDHTVIATPIVAGGYGNRPLNWPTWIILTLTSCSCTMQTHL